MEDEVVNGESTVIDGAGGDDCVGKEQGLQADVT